jgi:hypothetical protein
MAGFRLLSACQAFCFSRILYERQSSSVCKVNRQDNILQCINKIGSYSSNSHYVVATRTLRAPALPDDVCREVVSSPLLLETASAKNTPAVSHRRARGTNGGGRCQGERLAATLREAY